MFSLTNIILLVFLLTSYCYLAFTAEEPQSENYSDSEEKSWLSWTSNKEKTCKPEQNNIFEMLRSFLSFGTPRLSDAAPAPAAPAQINKLALALQLWPLGFVIMSLMMKSDVGYKLQTSFLSIRLAMVRGLLKVFGRIIPQSVQQKIYASIPVFVPHVRLSGMISAPQGGGGNTLNHLSTKKLLENTFAKLDAAPADRDLFPCVAITINSPGGSPTQSMMILEHIKELRKKYFDVPVITFCEDVAASGGYFLMCAGGKGNMYSNPYGIVGSIGVIGGGQFGFVDSLKKLGMERRVKTAGRNKGMLDPFKPEEESHAVHVQGMLDSMHEQFRQVVRTAREIGKPGDDAIGTVSKVGEGEGKDGADDEKEKKDKATDTTLPTSSSLVIVPVQLSDDDDVFSGAYWTGQQAIDLKLPLIDGVAPTVKRVLEDRFGNETMGAMNIKREVRMVEAKRPTPFEAFMQGDQVSLNGGGGGLLSSLLFGNGNGEVKVNANLCLPDLDEAISHQVAAARYKVY